MVETGNGRRLKASQNGFSRVANVQLGCARLQSRTKLDAQTAFQAKLIVNAETESFTVGRVTDACPVLRFPEFVGSIAHRK